MPDHLYFLNSGGIWSDRNCNARRSFDRFGQSVSISGEYIVCGAPLEDEDDEGMNTPSAAGSAYVFKDTSAGTSFRKLFLKTATAITSVTAVIEGSVLVSGYREDEDCNLLNTYCAGSAMCLNVRTLSQYQDLSQIRCDFSPFALHWMEGHSSVLISMTRMSRIWILSTTPALHISSV
jgi:hypothetical protein